VSRLTLRHDHLILDACCVINLQVSGKVREILQAVDTSLVVAQDVKEVEVLYTDEPDEKQPITLDELIAGGILQVTDFETEEEADTAVDLAAMGLDMGESVTAAIAIHRQWALATDERKCLRIVKELAPQLQLVTTPEMVHLWGDSSNPASEVLQEVVKNITQKGHYHPAKVHPLYSWWVQHLGP
jgi:predicted nucleic acid-binding protein